MPRDYHERAMTELTKEHVDQKFEELALAVAKGFEAVQTDIGKLDNEIKQLRQDIKALSDKLSRYMELSDKRYLELKHKNAVIAKWIKVIADKTGVKIDLAELEKF